MSSYAASCYTCFPKASCAFATSASSPTGGGPLSCHFAGKPSQCFSRKPNQKHPRPRKSDRFGSVPNVAGRWWSSRDLPPPNSNSARHPLSPESPHETTIPISHTRCSSPPAGGVRPACLRTSHPSPTSAQNPVPITRNFNQNSSAFTVSNSSSCSRSLPHSPQDHSISIKMHKRLPTGGSLQTAVSDAPHPTSRLTCALTVGRIRYSTRVCGQCDRRNAARSILSSSDRLRHGLLSRV